jgi:hypothetical protein
VYNLIVAPVLGDSTGPNPAGTLQGQFGGATPTTIQWKTSATGGDAGSEVYGKPITDSKANSTYPMFNWCKNGPNGPNSSGGIGGNTDWYIPAKNELAVLYFFLKPTTTANNTSSGINPNSVAPYTPNTAYGPGFPDVTTNALFAGGAQAFSTASNYWSATEDSSSTILAWFQDFSFGNQSSILKSSFQYARAVRRIAA